MSKKIFYEDDARARILAGAKELNDAVKTTLGPKGRNVVISRTYGNPIITKDGVTVAKNIELDVSDEERLGYDVGAKLIKEASEKLNDKAGDGTTSVTVLTYHIIAEANKLITAGYNANKIRKGLELACKDALQKLQDVSFDATTDKETLEQVATISASDAEIGKLVASTLEEVGKEGVVTVERGQGIDLEKEIVEGFTFDKGFVSPYMVTDQTRMEAVLENPAIIITDQKISNIQEFIPLLEKIAQTGNKNVVIIAENLEGEALGTIILNKLKGVFNPVAVPAPDFGENRKSVLEDIAVLTGGQVISEEKGDNFSDVDVSYLGSAKKVIVTKDSTTIIEGGGEVKERVKAIDEALVTAKSSYEKEKLEKRKASLLSMVAVIKVGGVSETEIEEKKFRVDDAVASVKSALEEGVVAGGGVTLVHLSLMLRNSRDDLDKEQTVGYNLLADSLLKPFETLMDNSGLKADVLLNKIYDNGKAGYGFDVTENEPKLIDLKAKGILDPTRVTKEVIQSAVSIAGTAITMGALVVDIPEKESNQQMPMM